jgi:hypothetical protein
MFARTLLINPRRVCCGACMGSCRRCLRAMCMGGRRCLSILFGNNVGSTAAASHSLTATVGAACNCLLLQHLVATCTPNLDIRPPITPQTSCIAVTNGKQFIVFGRCFCALGPCSARALRFERLEMNQLARSDDVDAANGGSMQPAAHARIRRVCCMNLFFVIEISLNANAARASSAA